MGVYLNSTTAYTLYKNETIKPYFVDKTKLLEELFPLVVEGNNHICITRPRRFGKTVMANMIASFFSQGCNSSDIFDSLKISEHLDYKEYKNAYPVIQIMFNELPRRCTSYEQYISRIEKILLEDLKNAYKEFDFLEEEAIWDVLQQVWLYNPELRFIFVLDEWDYIFHQSFMREEDKREHIRFLRNLLKDKPYVGLAYMTGILPIAKYSSGSELNMFLEYTLVTEEKYSNYFGFTKEEVDELYERYLKKEENIKFSREDLEIWYNGYQTLDGVRLYNPRSVTASFNNNNLGNYWTSSGPYDEIFYYVKHNIADIREDLALMVSGFPVPAKVQEYAVSSMNLKTKNEIFSAMVVYGFLSYEKGSVSIPNKELMDKFNEMLRKENSLGYIYELARESEKMLKATLAGDIKEMLRILEFAHNTEIPLLNYNRESDLTILISLIYLSARDFYRVEREDKAGTGYVDFIFYPELDKNADCIILELKVNHTAQKAIEQIKEKQYALKFMPKLGEKQKYTGRILAVGIAYDKETKKHDCKVEVLKE